MGSFENYNTEKPKENKPKGVTRRDFLKGIALAAGAYGSYKTGATVSEAIEKNFLSREEDRYEEEKSTAEDKEQEDYEIEAGPIRKRIYHPDMDREAAQKVLRQYNSGKVKLENVKIETENHWYFKYKTNPKLAKSLEDAYVNMHPWVSELKRVFQEEKVPDEFIYLAIPESHWTFDQVSPKGAAGPYQIMKGTAQLFGLRVNEAIDERLDVKKSARVCARHLREIFDKTGDWDLAMSGYNGSFVNKYIRWCKKKKSPCSYEAFIGYLEQRINKLKEDLAKKEWEHEVHESQSLESIGRYYDIDWEKIAKLNNFKKDKKGRYIIAINTGQKLKIPITDKKTKELIYGRIIGGYIENINYPGKFNAVMSRIKDRDFQKTVHSRMRSGSNLARK